MGRWTLVSVMALAAILAGASQARAQMGGDDDARCRGWGAAPGTQAYFECRATLERGRANGAYAPPPPPSQETNISDSMAKSLCERHARGAAPYPIKKLASHFVFPGREKRVTLSFAVDKPGASIAFWNAECKFKNAVMTSFDAR